MGTGARHDDIINVTTLLVMFPFN